MRGISKRFGATIALDQVDFEVEQGEVHALVGENGSGKSTLVKILAGAQPADEGTMVLDGRPFNPRNPMEARRQGIGMIYQELALCGHLSVAENVLLGMEQSHFGLLDRAEMGRRAHAALAKLGYPKLDTEAPVKSLPIAARQVVEIARAVAVGCRVVILDEPTSSLTEADVERLFEAVLALRNEGHAIIYISHFLDEIDQIADRLTVLRDGKKVATRPKGELTEDDIVALMVGRKIEAMYSRSPHAPGEPILEVQGLFGPDKPTGATFTLRRGEVLGVAGLNGSGRTELIRTIFGLDPVQKGEVKLGLHVGPASPSQRWAEGVGMLSEDRKLEGLALRLSIADNLTLTDLGRLGRAGTVSPMRQAEAATVWIDKLGIRCQGPGQIVGDLSGGNQQKVAIARLLYHGVDVLLLDEPTRGIDVGSKEQIYQLIDQAALEGKAVLMVSSYLPELLGVCDKIAVMHRGTLGEAVPAAETDAETIIREAIGA
jgi:ribose transport system ATP-binding protein